MKAAASLAGGLAPPMSASATIMAIMAMLIKMLKSLGLDLLAFAPCNTN
jgi:hypothetical protein